MKTQYRTIFLSDLHLGSSAARAQDLSRFLKRVKCSRLYLVGDVLDMWRLRKRWYWPADHNDVLRRILKMTRKGTEVIYIPGNHDEAARQYLDMEFGGVKLKPLDVHTTADGRRFLITHGDQYDLVIQNSRLLSMLGGIAYEWLIRLNVWYNKARSGVGMKYWSFSQFVKLKVKKACTFISRFEHSLIEEARRRGLDGVVCGHIHKAERRVDDGIEYLNCGDWVESCTALVEHMDGRMEIIEASTVVAEHHARKRRRKLGLPTGPGLFEAADADDPQTAEAAADEAFDDDDPSQDTGEGMSLDLNQALEQVLANPKSNGQSHDQPTTPKPLAANATDN